MSKSEAIQQFISGKKLDQGRARQALPILIRQAKAGPKPVTYSELAAELGMPNPRNLNYVLGAIGKVLEALNEEKGWKIPPIQGLILQQATGLPGDGFSCYIHEKNEYTKAKKPEKQRIFEAYLLEIKAFNRWDEVLMELELVPV